jgi:hypothetical protein
VDIEVIVTTKATWRGLTLYGFTSPDLQSWASRLGQICDSFGILDPAALWDVIPFSFIIDWFFTTQSFFHSLKPRFFSADAVVYDYMESVKVETFVEYRIINGYTPNHGVYPVPDLPSLAVPLDNGLVGREIYTTYCRHRFRPDGFSIGLSGISSPHVKNSFVSLSRIGIAASLTAQRVPR